MSAHSESPTPKSDPINDVALASDASPPATTSNGSPPPPASPPTASKSAGRPSFEFLVLAAIVFVLLAIPLAIATRQAVVAARRSAFKGQMQQIATAVNQYRDEYGCFPPAYTIDTDGRRLHSWRVLILPHLGQEALYRQIRLNESWDSSHNQQFHNQRPDVYRHPFARDTIPGEAHSLAVVGRDTMWPEQYSARINDLVRGVSMTGMLLEHSGLDINWMEPRDLTRKDVRTLVFPAGVTRTTGAFTGGVFIGLADGHARFMSMNIDRQLASAFFSANMENRALVGVDWPPEPGPALPVLPPARPASGFSATVVEPYLNVKFDSTKNIIYCATMQIAWDGLEERAKGPLRFDRAPEIANGLNLERFPKSDVNPDSYVAFGGEVSANTAKNLRDDLQKRFPGYPVPEISETKGTILAYSYLLKQLPFSADFERFGVPLEFQSARAVSKVEGFGIDSLRDNGNRLVEILGQVVILDHVSDDDFVLKLRTSKRRDEIFLAKVKPAGTLQETFKAVQQRIDSPAKNGFRKELGGGDRLQIPVLQLSIDKRFDELINLQFQNASLNNFYISDARQFIKFRLDETGAIIESHAVILGENGDSHLEEIYNPNKPRQLVFDRPFLLFVRETQAKAPYLVMWIANDELMEASKK